MTWPSVSVLVSSVAIFLCAVCIVLASETLNRHRRSMGTDAGANTFIVVVSLGLVLACLSDIGTVAYMSGGAFEWYGAPFIIASRGVMIWGYLRLRVLELQAHGPEHR